jgi:polyisoprenoid-binding protein YceI
MKTKLLTICLGLLIVQASSAAEIYQIDPVHSTVGFKVRHLFSKVTGRFLDLTGTINLDLDNPDKSSVDATIRAKSITTANDKRDTHLRSPDFFDVAKFETITFKSKKVTKTGDDTGDIVGDLTIHGVTKEVTLHVKFLGKGKGMQGQMQTGWEATAAIKRSDFGLVWSKAVEGVAVVGDDVDIDLQIEANESK